MSDRNMSAAAGGNAAATAASAGAHAIGIRQPLIDGVEKVTGSAKYTADLPAAGALVGAILRSPLAHATIRGIDVAAALAIPGVSAVVTGSTSASPAMRPASG